MMISLKKIGTLVLFILSISILSRCDFFHQQATITFETNGGTEVLPLTQDRGSKIDVTTIKEGYVFDAWCSDEGLTTSIDIRTMPNSNLTVYAKWVTMHERFTIDNKPYVYYGTYPQTVVSDDSLIASLNTLTVTNSNYYYEYQGKEYVKIVATPYIPPYFYKFNDGTKILAGQTYFFKVEPIKWRVLEEASGTYTLLSEYIIDNQVFYTSLEDRTISGETIYANNYEHSTIREWLNNGFYNQAFSALEKDEILTSFVDNSAETTGSSPNLYVSNNTYDKVYLLSYQEAFPLAYGDNSDSIAVTTSTDYARAIGVFLDTSIYSDLYGNSEWWLRSPYYGSHYSIPDCVWSCLGYFSTNEVDCNYIGARPAIKIR